MTTNGMTLPELLHSALESLEASPDGHLHLQLRRQIRASFGEIVSADEEGGPSDAVRALVALDKLTAQHVLYHWDQALPGDRRPYRVLELADEVLAGTVDPKTARKERGSFWRAAEDLRMPDEKGQISCAGVATAKVISTAFGAEISDETAPPGTDDSGIDPDLLDCQLYASLAEAPLLHLGADAPPEDIEARRAFWRWWLTEAVPRVARDAGLDVQ